MKKNYKFSYQISNSCIIIYINKKNREEIAYINEYYELILLQNLSLEEEREILKFVSDNKLMQI